MSGTNGPRFAPDYNRPDYTVGKPEYRRQAITARTVNDELRLVGAKVAKAKRRLDAMPNCPNRQAVYAHLVGALEAIIASAHAGRTYRQR